MILLILLFWVYFMGVWEWNESSNLRKEQISQVTIAWINYEYSPFRNIYLSANQETLKIWESTVTSLFHWDDSTFLAHVDGRIFYIPVLISQDGSVYRWIPLGIKHLTNKLSDIIAGIIWWKPKKGNI